MTTTTNYLDLDINKLFEEHTIKEIEQIQKKIQYESDRKKIELRTLVGERYRDLIQAADTIGKMKITSEQMILRIANIETKFQELQKKYLIGFKMEPVEDKCKREIQEISDSVVIQIKVLMDIPEYVWSSIEEKNLLQATQLFLIAQHINYCLTFEIGDIELAKKYPIVLKQWDVISQFKNIIFNECYGTLQSLDVSTENAANCLAALVLLNGISYTELLEKLISTRTHAVESIIKNDDDYSVKHRIKSCMEMLIQTVNLIYTCFINAGDVHEGLVSQNIKSVKDQDAYSLLSRLDLNNDMLQKFLPSVTKNHKPFTQETEETFIIPNLQSSIKSWLDWVKEFCSREVSKLLNLIMSVKGLYNIREEITDIGLPQNWNKIWEDLSLPRITFWVEYFQPLITDRVKCIVNDKWGDALSSMQTDTMKLLTKVANEKYEYPEHDLRWFVWKDSTTDIPQKLTKNGGLDNKRSLLMKAKGYSLNIVKLCENFDKNLYSLLADLEQYLYETQRVVSIKDNLLSTNIFLISNTFSDRSELHEHLQAISTSMIEKFLHYIKHTCLADKPECGQQDINAIVLARLLLALTSLCSNLNKCFTLSKVSGLTITNVKWQSVCDNLREESTFVWSIWAKTYKNKISKHRDKYMSKERLDSLCIHFVISEWEKVSIEENSEGKPIKSEILVPYQPSIPLQKYLTAISKDLNKVIPHTLPKKILHDIIEDTVTKVLNYYLTAASNKELRQKQALQVLFDIKYCTLLMVPRESKTTNEISNKACDVVLSKIDPFDYDVFNPFIHANVRRSVQKSLLILGNLVPHLEQLHSILGARGDYGTGEGTKPDVPAVLAICTGAPWFPPLAITAPTRNLPLVSLPIPEKTQRKKTTVKDNAKNDSAGATIKSGAAAFFGAMGTDWFSTS